MKVIRHPVPDFDGFAGRESLNSNNPSGAFVAGAYGSQFVGGELMTHPLQGALFLLFKDDDLVGVREVFVSLNTSIETVGDKALVESAQDLRIIFFAPFQRGVEPHGKETQRLRRALYLLFSLLEPQNPVTLRVKLHPQSIIVVDCQIGS
ncbi:MAG TPA: hypothetical protein VIW80_07270 [Pyrinomonadaceae bacterium]